MAPLYGYAIFHLNLAFSSVEETRRPDIVSKCYWPLLQLAADLDVPLGIEATGYTLREIHRIDPEWVDTFKHMAASGKVEFIGSGFSQLIGPLVPNNVLQANLELGQMEYERLLGFAPTLALVNEQAFSAGLVPAYQKAGYEALIMDWDACAPNHPDWDPEWRYAPQAAQGPDGETLPVLWTNTVAFQKVQRLAHDDISLKDYKKYLETRRGDAPRALALYGNDAEVFDFRPGRYKNEARTTTNISEWSRVRGAFSAFKALENTQFLAPSAVLKQVDLSNAGNELRLDSPQHPIPVKKQHKYNVSRWAVSGRDDLYANTNCWKLYDRLNANAPEGWKTDTSDHWKDLCYLWSSDFRTHITDQRWDGFQSKMKEALASFPAPKPIGPPPPVQFPVSASVSQDDRFLEVQTAKVRLRLNMRKGLAIDAVWLDNFEGPAPFATLPHGYFDDIGYGADFYSGTTILEAAGAPKITDFVAITPWIEETDDLVLISTNIETPLGPMTKIIEVGKREPILKWRLTINWPEWPRGSLRLGNFTLNPEAFEAETLNFRAHNGGREATAFPLHGQSVDHGAPVSFLVSANAGVGLTEGWMEIGDANRRYRIQVDMTKAALLGLVTHKQVDGRSFCRVSLSASEMDETRNPTDNNNGPREFSFAIAS